MEQVRDVFIFCVFTGLAFSDVKDLSPEHLVRDNKGELWIRKNRQKTKIMYNIPVLPVAASILEKYKNVAECTGKLLPVLSNQRMNSYLKEIADVCGLQKNLCTHMGRQIKISNSQIYSNLQQRKYFQVTIKKRAIFPILLHSYSVFKERLMAQTYEKYLINCICFLIFIAFTSYINCLCKKKKR